MSEIVIDPASDLFYTDFKRWFEGFRHFIFTTIVPRALPNDNKNRNAYALILISKEAMDIWVVAFTDASVDRNPGSNYETLEFLGDRQLESLFSNFAVSLYPQMNQALLTELKSTYMSKNKQKDMAIKLGLNKWVRTNFNLTIHTSEDLFESMFGALFKIGELYIGKGSGYALANNLLTNLYYDLEVNPDEILLRPITQFKEIVEKLGWGQRLPDKFVAEEFGLPENIEDESSDFKWKITLKLTKNAKEFIENVLNKPVSNTILSIQQSTNKNAVKTMAFDKALIEIKSLYGIDYTWASKYSDDELNTLIGTGAKNRMEIDKIVRVYFPKMTKSEKYQFTQFVGVDGLGKHIILVSVAGNFKEPLTNLKKFAIDLYASSGRQDPTKLIEYKPL